MNFHGLSSASCEFEPDSAGGTITCRFVPKTIAFASQALSGAARSLQGLRIDRTEIVSTLFVW
jgi:hypothetical protein